MKSKNENKEKGVYSVEELNHFNCGTCKKWWSIGDPKVAKKKNQEWFCPWCGLQQTFKKVQ
ncbi:hypothetical protein IT403_00050 [Candidatus Nomurabacteria bacterium]|nr:hypothetical protein [Candidatus Nomurabacteria bacterium]